LSRTVGLLEPSLCSNRSSRIDSLRSSRTVGSLEPSSRSSQTFARLRIVVRLESSLISQRRRSFFSVPPLSFPTMFRSIPTRAHLVRLERTATHPHPKSRAERFVDVTRRVEISAAQAWALRVSGADRARVRSCRCSPGSRRPSPR
jgi:hypothetical protein